MEMGLMQLFKGMQDNSAAQATMARDHSAAMMAMMERMAAPRSSGIETLLPALTPLLTPLIQGIASRRDPVEIATTLMASIKPAPESSGSLSALREFLEIKELLGDAGGAAGGGENDKWLDLIGKVVPGALDLLKAESARTGQPISAIARPVVSPRPAASPALSIGGPTAPADATVAPSPSSVGAATMNEAHAADEWTPLEPYIAQLVGMAAQNRDPYGVMQTVKTFAPAPMLGAIRELVAREDAVPMILQRFPALQPHQAWTALFIEEFRLEFFGEGDDDDGDVSEPPGAVPASDPPAVEGA